MDDLELALALADLADSMTLPRFGARDLHVERKPDLTEVTEVDRGVEEAIRARLATERPGDRIVGEEFGGDRETAGRRWVIDPIDGTRAFIRGNETWGTLIALQLGGTSVVAVASVPAMSQRYAARRGDGATMNGSPIRVSGVDRVEDALLAHTSVKGFIRAGSEEQFRTLAAICWDARGLGNTMSHLSVARGSADVAWTSRASLWDYAALALIVTEAGGRFTDRSGDSPFGGPGLSSNGVLHERLLDIAVVRSD